MEFLNFIDKVGVSNLAAMLNLNEASVYKWRRLESAPRPETAFLITRLSYGQVSLENVFMPYIEKQLAGKTFTFKTRDGQAQFEIKI